MSRNWVDVVEKFNNMNEKNRRSDELLVTFFNLPENMGNILGRQVKSVTKPTIEMQTVDLRHRGATYKDKQNVTATPVNISFYDDENSVTETILFMQFFRQQNKLPDRFGISDMGRDYRFDIKIETFNSVGEITSGMVLRRCFIQTIDPSDPNMASDEETEINIMVEFDNIDILLFDEYMNLR